MFVTSDPNTAAWHFISRSQPARPGLGRKSLRFRQRERILVRRLFFCRFLRGARRHGPRSSGYLPVESTRPQVTTSILQPEYCRYV